MILVDRAALPDFERRRPNAHIKAQLRDPLRHGPHSMRKLRSVRSCVIAAGVAVTKVEMETVVAEVLQVLRLPERVRESISFGDVHVERRPTPPSEHVAFGIRL